MAPHLIFGTSTFGMDMTEFQDAESVRRVLAILKELGIDRLDTAARYPPFKPGRSEQLFGEANKLAANFLIDTKVYTDTGTDGSGDLSREAVEKSINSSFLRLRAPEGVNQIQQTSDHGQRLACSMLIVQHQLGQHPVRTPP